jgi:hypothetical protein
VSLFWAVATPAAISDQFARAGRFINPDLASDLSMAETSFFECVNLISFFKGKLMIGLHLCSFDLAIGEAGMLSQLARQWLSSKLHFVIEFKSYNKTAVWTQPVSNTRRNK